MYDIVELILFILPAYTANAVPVVLGGGAPLDLGKKFFDGRMIFGKGKTIRGFLAGVAAGTVVGVLLTLYVPLRMFATPTAQLLGCAMLSLGTMTGDALGSFIKRRLGIKQGKPFLLDQLFFLFVALLFAFPFTEYSFYTAQNIGILVVLTLIAHPLANIIANKSGLKKVPW